MDEKEHKRFFACIGNPPYQDDTPGGNDSFAPPLYHYMIDAGSLIADRVEMITPARFLFNAGSTPKAWNEKKLNDPHFKVIEYQADASQVFPKTDIKGGVAVTYYDETKEFEPIRVFVPFDELKSLIPKVTKCLTKNGSLSDIIYSQTSYRFSKNVSRDYDEYADKIRYDSKLGSNCFLKFSELFRDKKPNDDYIGIVGRYGTERKTMYIKREYVDVSDNFSKWKVFIPKANGSGAFGEVVTTPMIGVPMIGHTQTFISAGSFDTELEAQNCMKYIKTKFTRTLLGILKVTPDNPAPKWRYVPLQDFTLSSDIDWSQPIADIDRQLYAKYNLDDNEITFIEEHVKAME